MTYKDSECSQLLQNEIIPRTQLGIGSDSDVFGFKKPVCRKYACNIVRGTDGSVSSTSCAGLGLNEFVAYSCEYTMDAASTQQVSAIVCLIAAVAALLVAW